MNALAALVLVAGLFALGLLGAASGLQWVFGVLVPYLAVGIFVVGLAVRVLGWARVPVPFRIPTTCGQQKSLSWIKSQKLDNPSSGLGVVGRMALEVLFFRSLLRNTEVEQLEGPRLVYRTDLGLWAGALAMHWALAVVLLRHLRLMTDPVPGLVVFVERVDGFFEIGLPVVFATTVIFLGALLYLMWRRLTSPLVHYISLLGDYFALWLLLGIGTSGAWLRHLSRTDVAGVKELVLGLVHFQPVLPPAVHPLFYGHLFLVCVLLVYFPLGKLMHVPGVFLSPTRNLANNSRSVRHVNPWDYPVDVHSYEEYEDEFREKMVAAGLPVERQ